jgi:hypothetical protein
MSRENDDEAGGLWQDHADGERLRTARIARRSRERVQEPAVRHPERMRRAHAASGPGPDEARKPG